MIDSTRASNVWSSVALVAVRVMMAVTMYIFGTLFVLRLLFLLNNMEMTEIDGEHAFLSACKMFGSSCAPVTLFHLLKGLSVRMEQATASSNAVEIRLQELRSSSVTRGREIGSRGPWKKFPHWSFAKWQVLGMLVVDRTRSGSRLESCALDCWKSWHPQRRSGVAEKGYDES